MRSWRVVLLSLFGLLLAGPTAVAVSPASASPPEPDRPATAYTWVGSAQDSHADNHSWTDQRNWSPQGVPGNGDSVSISPPDGGHCVAHVDNVPSGVTLQNLSLSVGAFCAASINGGSLTVTGQLSWDTGVVNTPLTVAAGATATVSGFVDGNPHKQLDQSLVVEGLLKLVGANLQLTDPKTLTIQPGGQLTWSGNSLLTSNACCVTPARLINNGTISGTDGMLTVQGVELDQAKLIAIASGATLRAAAAPVKAADHSQYSGGGTFQLWNGSAAVFTGTQTLGAGFHLEQGDDGAGGNTLGGTTVFTGPGEYDWTGGTLMANLTLARDVTMHVYGANTGNGKRILSGLDNSGGGQVPSTVAVDGTVVVDQQASIVASQTAKLVLSKKGRLSLAPGTQLTTASCCIDPSAIVNNGGQVTVPSGTGPVVVNGMAYQAKGGSLQVSKGSELQLTGGPQSSLADTTIAGGGRVTLADPTAASGVITLNGKTALRLDRTPGSIDGVATIGGNGTVEWLGGSFSGAMTIDTGVAVKASGAGRKFVANVNGGSQPSTLLVKGALSLTKGTKKAHNLLDIGSSTLTTTGATTVAKLVEINGGSLVNAGTLTFDPGKKGTDFTAVNLALTNQGTLALASGTLVSSGSYAQAAGSTSIAKAATFQAPFSSHPLTVTGGTLAGFGTVDGRLSNSSGTVDPGGIGGAGGQGTLTVTGDYVQGAGGFLHLDLSAAHIDVLAVGGAATIAGGLISNNVSGYTPHLGDTVTPITSTGSLSWSVGCTITSGQGSDAGHWEPVARAGAVDLVWKSGSDTTC